jgi:excisionase family DNA binding protein
MSRTLTIDEAATLTGHSRRAIAARIERGTLKGEKVGKLWRVDLAELVRAGLVPLDPPGHVTDLLDRLEAQAKRIGELEAENRRLRGAP